MDVFLSQFSGAPNTNHTKVDGVFITYDQCLKIEVFNALQTRARHWVPTPTPMPMGVGWAWVRYYCLWVGMDGHGFHIIMGGHGFGIIVHG